MSRKRQIPDSFLETALETDASSICYQSKKKTKSQRLFAEHRQRGLYLLFSGCLLEGSGWKTVGSTALGITETRDGDMVALRTVFSLLVKQTVKPYY